MNTIITKKKLEQRLLRRGMLITTLGDVIEPPTRMYKNLGEEILWILNQEHLSLTVKELSNYLSKDKKIINKVMQKLTATNVNLVKKRKESSHYLYSANFNKDLDIPTLYKMTRMESTKKIR